MLCANINHNILWSKNENKMGNSFLLIIAGLLIFYLVISDKWKCVEMFAACVTDKQSGASVAPTVFNNVPQVNTNPNVVNTQIGVPSFPTLALNSNFLNNGF